MEGLPAVCITVALLLLGAVGLAIYALLAVSARASLLQDEEEEVRVAAEIAKEMLIKYGNEA